MERSSIIFILVIFLLSTIVIAVIVYFTMEFTYIPLEPDAYNTNYYVGTKCNTITQDASSDEE
jgi:quinol-cytochrome oxidoreductase complex cytochrome b subunit